MRKIIRQIPPHVALLLLIGVPSAFGGVMAARSEGWLVCVLCCGILFACGYLFRLIVAINNVAKKNFQLVSKYAGKDLVEPKDQWGLVAAVLEAYTLVFAAKRYPERIGAVITFFLSKKVRERCFEPFFEELKEDRLMASAAARSSLAKFVVEMAFIGRLVLSFLSSFVCMLRELFPLGEIIRSFFRGG